MQTMKPSFTVRFFEPRDAESGELDQALAIYQDCLSPILKTGMNEIRDKVANPVSPEGCFYFAALYRSRRPIGFAMFGHYPSSRLLVIDHMAIEEQGRYGAAFYAFTQGLQDFIDSRALVADFAAVELEAHGDYGNGHTDGREMVRLLSRLGFAEVHTPYAIADLEVASGLRPNPGVLMLKAATRLHRIRRTELLRIYDIILFQHYLPWYRLYRATGKDMYEGYLRGLHASFAEQLQDEYVRVNGPEQDGLSRAPPDAVIGTREIRIGVHVGLFAVVLSVISLSMYISGLGERWWVPVLLATVAAYAAVVAISEGKAFDVFEKALLKLPGGTRKSRYLPPPDGQGSTKSTGRKGQVGSRDRRSQ